MPNRQALVNFSFGVLVALASSWFITPILAYANGAAEWNVTDQPAKMGQYSKHAILRIPAAAFRSIGANPSGYYYEFITGEMDGGGGGECVMAPVYLPDEVTVWRLMGFVYDNDVNNDLTINLMRVNTSSGTADTMATVSSHSAEDYLTYPATDTIAYATVSNADYAYYLTTCLSTSQTKLYSVQVWYGLLSTFLPLTTR